MAHNFIFLQLLTHSGTMPKSKTTARKRERQAPYKAVLTFGEGEFRAHVLVNAATSESIAGSVQGTLHGASSS